MAESIKQRFGEQAASAQYIKPSSCQRKVKRRLTRSDPLRWREMEQHINLLGEYDFSDEKLRYSVGIRPPKLTP